MLIWVLFRKKICTAYFSVINTILTVPSMSNDHRQPSKTYFRVTYSQRSMSVHKPY